MTDDRKFQLMQSALDEALSPQEEEELNLFLEEDATGAREFDKLQKVDMMLRTAPHERAPERLAMTIMARLGETVMELQRQKGEQEELAQATVQIAMSTVAIAALPLLIGASWLILNAQANPELFEKILIQVAALALLVIDTLDMMLAEAQAMFQENPQAAMALLALMPIAVLTLVKHILGQDDEDTSENDTGTDA